MRHIIRVFCLALLLFVLSTDHSFADVRSRRVVTGLSQPVFATAAPNDPSRLFILEKNGQIKIFDRDSETILDTPFIDLLPRMSNEGQDGLFGMAFHPEYANNGQFYVYYMDSNRNSQISQFEVSGDANIADAASEKFILGFEQPHEAANSDWHAGGWIGFSPTDKHLYIASGDGAGAHDPLSHGQNTDTLLGSMIRLDVDGDDFPTDATRNYAIPADNPFVGGGGAAENWAYGLREPWRASFDRQTGDLFVTDVGQGTREEVNYQHADAAGGANYGWPLREGTIETPTGDVGGPRPVDNVDPIYDYMHGSEEFQGNSVAGGYVYRGPDPSLQGTYFTLDFIRGTLTSIEIDRDTQTSVDGSLTNWTELLAPDEGSYAYAPSMGEDSDGNLYVVGIGGDIFMLEAIPAVASNGAFLASLYPDILGREGEDAGVAHWGTELSAGNLTPQEVARIFWLSRERLGGVVGEFYDSFLERPADEGGSTHWATQLANGESETDVITAFLMSPEFTSSHPSDEEFVSAMYELILGREGEEEGRLYHLGTLAGDLDREDVARTFVDSPERRAGLINSLYIEFLGRVADEAEMDAHLSLMKMGAIDLGDVAADILTSDEYVYTANRVIGDFDTYIAGLPFGGPAPVTSLAVPEPSSVVLALIGTAIVTLRRRRR